MPQVNERQCKEEVLTKEKASQVSDISEALTIKEGNVFFLADTNGQIPLTRNHGYGLYYRDCRYLNGYEVKLGGRFPFSLGYSDVRCFEAAMALTNDMFHCADGTCVPKEKLGLKWRRLLNGRNRALHDEIIIENYHSAPITVPISLSFETHFDDIFLVRGLLPADAGSSTVRQKVNTDGFSFDRTGKDQRDRRLIIKMVPAPFHIEAGEARFDIHLEPREQKSVRVSLYMDGDGERHDDRHKTTFIRDARRELDEAYHEWFGRLTKIETDDGTLNRLVDRSLHDLYLLRTHLDNCDFLAAGVPWFVTLFGRDASLTTLQMMMFNPAIAEETLHILAQYQGAKVDHWRDEEPGKILHELRVGELAGAGEIPHTPYYGAADATLLFLLLMSEHLHWTGDQALWRRLSPSIMAALDWMECAARATGYIGYDSEVYGGRLVNQGWKDSGNAIVREDGSLPRPPIYLVEIQGYAYLVRKRYAEIFRWMKRDKEAAHHESMAERLRQQFDRDFWVADRDFLALGLEKDLRPITSIASNPGHALWSGIVDPRKAESVMRRLCREDMDSGWGIRTLSSAHPSYDPVSYHLGSVWPHDNAIIADGFRRYGFDEAARDLCCRMFETAVQFKEGRLPELFSGYSREEFSEPIRYPVACHPQAWAAATIPYMLHIMLGLHPNAMEGKLEIARPLLPWHIDSVTLRHLKVGSSRLDLAFKRRNEKIVVEVLNLKGDLEVSINH